MEHIEGIMEITGYALEEAIRQTERQLEQAIAEADKR